MGAGSLDMTVVADIGALIGKAGGLKTSLTAMGNPEGTAWWLLVSPASSIYKVSDLKGKKVATVKGTLPHFYLLQALKASGLSESDINLINMTMPDSQQALRSGQIDATVLGSWTGAQAVSQGFRAIDSTKETPIGRGTMVVVANDSFIASHPTFFPRFYKVRQQAADWANANRAAAIDALAKADGGIDRSLEGPLYSNPFNFDQSLSADVLTRIKAGEGFLSGMGLTQNKVDVDAWVNKAVEYQKK
jgi:ABC-type nitrate/sulfonate/bicarbonate transport system substrate-binding protein